jgi:prepilin-type N-terminal cleavage/methylation domain-containing protein
MCRQQHRNRAFTLIELLVVIAIIALLIGMLLPAIQKVRAAAAQTACANNLKQMGLAMHNYHNDHEFFPRSSTVSWMVYLLPYIEQASIAAQIEANPPVSYTGAPWHPNYGPPAAGAIPIKTYYCPADPQGLRVLPNFSAGAMTDYAGITGPSFQDTTGVLNSPTPLSVLMITDGTSNTVMIGERPFCGPPLSGAAAMQNFYEWRWWYYNSYGGGSLTYAIGLYALSAYPDNLTGVQNNNWYNIVWSNFQGKNCGSGPFYFGQGPNNTNDFCSFNYMWSCHTRGANFSVADGSVRFVSYAIDKPTLAAASTFAGGEVLGNGW